MALGKRIVINTRERAVSDDINDAQAFQTASMAEWARAVAAQAYDWWYLPGQSGSRYDGASPGTPLHLDVFDGLMLTESSPGVVSILSGVAGFWTGAPAAGDSGYVVVNSAGDFSGSLTIATNGGVSPRCDVIECQPVDTVLLTSSRDVYNATTGLFTATSLTKQAGPTLTFRVRQGTPGVPPEYAAGWAPIALAIVQPSATLSQIDYYDVRALVRERGQYGHANPSVAVETPIEINTDWWLHCAAGYSGIGGAGTPAFWEGRLAGAWLGRAFGGLLIKGTPVDPTNLAGFGHGTTGGGDFLGIEFDPTNLLRGTGTSWVSTNDLAVLSIWFPNLSADPTQPPLPRCVRYVEGGTRMPYGPRGLPIINSLQQDGILTGATSIQSRGIAGCLGYGFPVPIAMSAIDLATTQIATASGRGGGLVTWNSGPSGAAANGAIISLPLTDDRIANSAYYASLQLDAMMACDMKRVRKMRVYLSLKIKQYGGASNICAIKVNACVSTVSDPRATGSTTATVTAVHPASQSWAGYTQVDPASYLTALYVPTFAFDVEPIRTSVNQWLHVQVKSDGGPAQIVTDALTFARLIGVSMF